MLADGASDLRFQLEPELPGSHYMDMVHASHGSPGGCGLGGPTHGSAANGPAADSLLRVQLVAPGDTYCARVMDVQVRDQEWHQNGVVMW